MWPAEIRNNESFTFDSTADAQYRLTSTSSKVGPDPGSTVGAIVGPTVAVVVIAIIALISFLVWHRRRQLRRSAVAAFAGVTEVHNEFNVVVGALTWVDEEEELVIAVKADTIPGTWDIAAAEIDQDRVGLKFKQIVQLGNDHQVFDELLSATFKTVVTQDRKFSKQKDTCRKTHRGYTCVRLAGTLGVPTCYRVLNVFRVEDSERWDRYYRTREQIRRKDDRLRCACPDPPLLTTACVGANPSVFSRLGDSNEVYLWHGTHVRNAMSIAKRDFNVGFSKGGGHIYMSESCTKADEYSCDEIGGYYEGAFALLFCRTTLGKFRYTVDRHIQVESLSKSGDFDSVLVDLGNAVRTVREFVCYDRDQVYPEFLIVYERIFASCTPFAGLHSRSPLYPQMPIYWRNWHKDMRNETFFEEISVRSDTRCEILNLVRACSKKRQNVHLVQVQRIENSHSWDKYLRFKVALRRSLVDRSPNSVDRHAFVTPLRELHPNSTELLTELALSENFRACTVASQHLEKRLGEYFLWHGCSRAAAQGIVKNHFRKRIKSVHGRRFGDGLYFTDLLDKSLEFSPLTPEGTHYILLCRVCCGESYYTIANSAETAHVDAKRENKHSVVAKPCGVGPLEVVCHTEDQAYPEYKIELKFT